MSLARVQFFSISLDGFGTGEPQSLDTSFGHAGEPLHEWMFTTRWWNEMAGGQPGGTGGIDDAGSFLLRRSCQRTSAITSPDPRGRR